MCDVCMIYFTSHIIHYNVVFSQIVSLFRLLYFIKLLSHYCFIIIADCEPVPALPRLQRARPDPPVISFIIIVLAHVILLLLLLQIVSLFPLFPGTNELDQIHKIHNIQGTPPPEVCRHFKIEYSVLKYKDSVRSRRSIACRARLHPR